MIQTIIVHPVEGQVLNVVADITEKLCKPFCILGPTQPTATVSFVVGAVQVIGEVAIFPMTALVTVTSPTADACGCAHSQVFREQFKLAMQATTANTLTIEEGDATIVTPAYTKCCKAQGVNITKSFTATIA